jgi:hypothetical protein
VEVVEVGDIGRVLWHFLRAVAWCRERGVVSVVS